MKIHIPNSAFLGNIDPFLRNFDASSPEVLEITEHEPAGRFIPLKQVTNSEKLTEFITEVVPLLHLSPKHAEPIRYILSELMRNVFEHAVSKIGVIMCAQYYKKSNTIRIGIIDRGVGILNTISALHRAKTDLEAIRLALTPGITGTTKRIGGTDYNAGAGLFFIKSIATVNKDFFVIYSGNGMYKLLKADNKKSVRLHADPFKDKHSKGENFPYWQGTAVGIDINLDSTEEFSLLLDLIRKSYSKAVKEQRKAYYKKARFI